jgi:hypothetical protein
MFKRLFLGTLFGALSLSACLRDTRPATEREGFGSNVPEMKAPTKNRCAKAEKDNKVSCEKAKETAQVWARHLSPGDMVCLENGVGEEPNDACLARSAVMDSGTDRVLLEIRTAKPESRWFEKTGSQVWFEEGALVDLFLAERGY